MYDHSDDSTTSLLKAPAPSAVLSAQAVNAPVFVPKTPNANMMETSATPPPPHPDTPSFVPDASATEFNGNSESYQDYDYTDSNGNEDSQADPLSDSIHSLQMNPYEQMPLDYEATNGVDMYYPEDVVFSRQPLNYHLYSQPRPSELQQRYFVSDSLREDLQKRSEAIHTGPPPGLTLPDEVSGYHSFVPLELVNNERRKFGNWNSTVYRAKSTKDGLTYCLRRIENFRLTSNTAFQSIEAWSRIHHSSIASVKEAFTTRAFGDNSLFVVFDYYPNAQNLHEAHVRPKNPLYQNGRAHGQNASMRVPERTIWSYIVQIANAVKIIHDAGLAVRYLDASKIILTGKNRVRLSSCGIVDVLTHDAQTDLQALHQEDIMMLGKLIFVVACNNIGAINNIQKSIDVLSRHYSPDLKKLAIYLISSPGPHKTLTHVFEMIGGRVLIELDESLNAADRLEAELSSELENGRLFRLMCKFGFINERPEFARDARWSETGDRYIIKLFRDYVFHQVDEHGRPVVNMSHVLTCLNKLDAGVDEKIMLISRDEQSCLVVSYREVKSCIEAAFSELGMATI